MVQSSQKTVWLATPELSITQERQLDTSPQILTHSMFIAGLFLVAQRNTVRISLPETQINRVCDPSAEH